MGRQTAVAMTDIDEVEFLEFLRASADIQLLEDFAPTKQAIWVDRFLPRTRGHWFYYIWNVAFPWNAEYAQVRKDVPLTQRPGSFYVSNTFAAPLIEYSRHNFNDKYGLSYGRVYWSKYFSAEPGDISYDVKAFSAWYDQVARWIRKNGKQKEKGAYNAYFLPDAMRREK